VTHERPGRHRSPGAPDGAPQPPRPAVRALWSGRTRPYVSRRMWRLRPSRDLPPSYPRLSSPTVSEASTD
jgi:hypothetical protein